jgi:hypothetical protein
VVKARIQALDSTAFRYLPEDGATQQVRSLINRLQAGATQQVGAAGAAGAQESVVPARAPVRCTAAVASVVRLAAVPDAAPAAVAGADASEIRPVATSDRNNAVAHLLSLTAPRLGRSG